MKDRDTAQEEELSVEYPDGCTEEPVEGRHLDGGEDPGGGRLSWSTTSVSGPQVQLSYVDLEPTTPSPAAVDSDGCVLLDYLTAQPQRDQREADPELPAGSDTALPLVHLQRMEEDDAAQREMDIDDIEASISTIIREAGPNMELDDELLY